MIQFLTELQTSSIQIFTKSLWGFPTFTFSPFAIRRINIYVCLYKKEIQNTGLKIILVVHMPAHSEFPGEKKSIISCLLQCIFLPCWIWQNWTNRPHDQSSGSYGINLKMSAFLNIHFNYYKYGIILKYNFHLRIWSYLLEYVWNNSKGSADIKHSVKSSYSIQFVHTV